MTAEIIPNLKKHRAAATTAGVCEILSGHSADVVMNEVYKPAFADIPARFLPSEAIFPDVIITVGGDGTILRNSARAVSLNVPLLGINTGTLGFMASVEADELDKLVRLCSGEYTVDKRMLLDISVIHDDKPYAFTALNDVVISRPYSKIADYTVSVNRNIVTRVRADGIVFSTPTGSTAYALSAGGPIIEPTLECIEYTTICPHSLFSRPMLFSASDSIEVTLSGASDDVYITVDGSEKTDFSISDRIIITKSKRQLSLINLNTNTFFDAINNKMMKSLKGEH